MRDQPYLIRQEIYRLSNQICYLSLALFNYFYVYTFDIFHCFIFTLKRTFTVTSCQHTRHIEFTIWALYVSGRSSIIYRTVYDVSQSLKRVNYNWKEQNLVQPYLSSSSQCLVYSHTLLSFHFLSLSFSSFFWSTKCRARLRASAHGFSWEEDARWHWPRDERRE